jgi:hypothetical protein
LISGGLSKLQESLVAGLNKIFDALSVRQNL